MPVEMNRGRWLGAAALILSAAMLICGETVLKAGLAGGLYLAYWLVCLILTGLAIVAALRDLRAQHRKARAEQRELLESTLRQIQAEAHAKAPQPKPIAEHDPGHQT